MINFTRFSRFKHGVFVSVDDRGNDDDDDIMMMMLMMIMSKMYSGHFYRSWKKNWEYRHDLLSPA